MTPETAAKLLGVGVHRELEGHREIVKCVAWSCSGHRLASGSHDRTVRLWSPDARSGSSVELRGHADKVQKVHWHPSDANVLASAGDEKLLFVWDARKGEPAQRVESSGKNINLTWSPCGQFVALGNVDDQLTVLDARTWRPVLERKMPYQLNEIAFSRSSQHLALTSDSGTLEIVAFPSFEPVASLEAHAGTTSYCVKVDSTGRLLASGGGDCVCALWDTAELACVRTLTEHDSPVRSLAFSAHGHLLASAGEEHSVELTDLRTGASVRRLATTSPVFDLAWHPRLLLLALTGFRERVAVFGFVPPGKGL